MIITIGSRVKDKEGQTYLLTEELGHTELVHRDIKPENILVSNDTLKIRVIGIHDMNLIGWCILSDEVFWKKNI